MQLRPYQIPAVETGIDFFKSPKEPAVMVLPTAAGKSIIIAKIAEAVEGKLLVLQPSKELLAQNHSKFTLLGGTAAIYSASFGSKQIGNTTYATLGSIYKRGMTFRAMGFKQVIIDEIHLYKRGQTDGMLARFLRESEINKILGLTATPIKLQQNFDMNGNTFSKLMMLTSRSKHGQLFKEIIHVTQIE